MRIERNTRKLLLGPNFFSARRFFLCCSLAVALFSFPAQFSVVHAPGRVCAPFSLPAALSSISFLYYLLRHTIHITYYSGLIRSFQQVQFVRANRAVKSYTLIILIFFPPYLFSGALFSCNFVSLFHSSSLFRFIFFSDECRKLYVTMLDGDERSVPVSGNGTLIEINWEKGRRDERQSNGIGQQKMANICDLLALPIVNSRRLMIFSCSLPSFE